MEGWVDGRVDRWLAGSMIGGRDGRVDRWKCGQMAGWIDGRVGRRKGEQMSGWINDWREMEGWVDGRVDRWLAGWIDGWLDRWKGGWLADWVGRWLGRWMARLYIYHFKELSDKINIFGKHGLNDWFLILQMTYLILCIPLLFSHEYFHMFHVSFAWSRQWITVISAECSFNLYVKCTDYWSLG